MTDGMTTPLLRLRNIGKTYGFTTVLTGIDLDLAVGETIALLGENGAGKSTLSKIITGVVQPDHDGEMQIAGVAVAFHAPRDALAKGIALIPQELAYVPAMSVADNIMLNRWQSTAGFLTAGRVKAAALEAAQKVGIDLGDLSRPMTRLRLAERQLVEIVKAITRDARIIVLDEPTAALSQDESRRLFAIVERLNRDGVGIIYVSHRMDEVYDFSHRVVVLRNGRKVADLVTQETTHAQLIVHMLGHDRAPRVGAAPPSTAADAPIAVQVDNWNRSGLPSLAGVSFSLAPDEVLGIYGLRGSGADLVAEGFGGVRPDISGAMTLFGARTDIPRNPIAARRLGIAHVPAERKREGLVLKRSIQENLVMQVMKSLSRFGILYSRRERNLAADLAKRFDVRFSALDQAVGQLSGGNQQKILLASRVATKPRFLVLHEPTRGVDVGARGQIHTFLRGIARGGCPTLVVTSDIEEAVDLCDRLIVVREGRIVGELTGTDKTQQSAATLAAGDKH
ncbi:sugar ABC transporter ATP-binding protein [Devosia sp. ZB163]|uniref:sugar ABC transporter ATP-binding protein n=1 Tax=Devosia sp. ZB163 TaxID=3025938 RepID=UPI00235FC3E8|nr:sugar ABC transporter ATP-binding protein [Devosia sp. ZB163]MDC9822778.1 sugar ABC transporter ATP-binding protein [Devosia sp. ZB163]